MSSLVPETPLEGGCACGHIRYCMTAHPLAIHCCHCHHCQRETGSAFALNALLESPHLTLQPPSPAPVVIATPTLSGTPQRVARCPRCYVAVWSHYSSAGETMAFVRVGTLDPEAKNAVGEPTVHIYCESKVGWMGLPEGARVCGEYYDRREVWGRESLERLERYWPVIVEWKEKKEKEMAEAEGKVEQKEE
ncbi:Mss4-like protein [Lineolata rhizophorae]|uniref:Mss4-like protein n=1 Tax=Lineolata rhizophorae TaxID=578093 RepID=A0A6A6NZ79_9PEZI|nr:Mss4-like protein [Lineolata rhizophorae]